MPNDDWPMIAIVRAPPSSTYTRPLVAVLDSGMGSYRKQINIRTAAEGAIVDLTSTLEEALRDSGFKKVFSALSFPIPPVPCSP